MKKIFTIALLALGMTAVAQNVTPLNIQIPELKFDSLRSLYISEPSMYRASLEVLVGQYAEVDRQIKTAKTELKAEQDHSKAMSLMIKEANALADDLIKLYTKEADELKSMQKNIEKQMVDFEKNIWTTPVPVDTDTVAVDSLQEGKKVRAAAKARSRSARRSSTSSSSASSSKQSKPKSSGGGSSGARVSVRRERHIY